MKVSHQEGRKKLAGRLRQARPDGAADAGPVEPRLTLCARSARRKAK